MSKQSLRFVVLCDSLDLPLWQANCLKEVIASGLAQPTGVVLRAPQPRQGGLSRWRKRWADRRLLLWRAFNRIYVDKVSRANKPTDVRAMLDQTPILQHNPQKVGRHREALGADALAFIERNRPDFILRFGFGILTGEVLRSAKYGVWSYHHGDPRSFRGHPPAFWELVAKSPVVGAVLQVLNEDLDGGAVIHRGNFKSVLHSYAKTRDNVYLGTSSWVRRACAAILHNGFETTDTGPPTGRPKLCREPRNSELLRFMLSSVSEFFAAQKRYKLNRQNWNCAVVRAPIHVVAGLDGPAAQAEALRDAHWMPTDRRTFRADPFGYQLDRKENIRIFFELYNWRRRRGTIAAVDYRSNRFGPAKPILDAPTHLSYPFIMQHESSTYYIPEHSDARNISAFLIDDDGLTTQKKTLFPMCELIDATFLQIGDKVFMFALDESRSTNTDLNIYFANCLEGPWRPHPLNPVKSDIRSSRPGGTLFMNDGKLYRPAQDCSTHYGSATVINEVKLLTETDYIEEEVYKVQPLSDGPFPYGLHTLSSVGEYTLIDGARLESIVSFG